MSQSPPLTHHSSSSQPEICGTVEGAILTVNLAAIADNWKTLAKQSFPAKCAGVVKADAYGLGIEPVSQTLWDSGCRTFFVALLSEGRRLRSILSDAEIYVLNGLPPGSAPHFTSARLRPVLGSFDEVNEFAAHCDKTGTRHPAAIHFDTGMNRLGFRIEEAQQIIDNQILTRIRVSLLMSHLACADDSRHPMNKQQLEQFSEVRKLFPEIPASFANSAGVLMKIEPFDMVRPGIALYGGEALGDYNPMRSVVTLEAPVIQIRHAKPNETVGYGACETLKRPTTIAVIGIGYADGYLRAESSKKEVAVRGCRIPIVGRHSMDLTMVDVTDVAEVSRGCLVELIGPTISVDEVAKAAGTIGYEVLVRLSNRVTRKYIY